MWPNRKKSKTKAIVIKLLLSKAFFISNEESCWHEIPNLSGKLISYCVPLKCFFFSALLINFGFAAVIFPLFSTSFYFSVVSVCLSQTHAVTINPFWLRQKYLYKIRAQAHIFTFSYNNSNKMSVSQQTKRKAAERKPNNTKYTAKRNEKDVMRNWEKQINTKQSSTKTFVHMRQFEMCMLGCFV